MKIKSEKEDYFKLIENQYDDLLNEFALNKKNDLNRNKEIIKEILSEEITSRYYFQEGRIRSWLKFDKDIIEAINYLKNQNLYDSVLSAR